MLGAIEDTSLLTYLPSADIIAHPGLRLVLVRGVPSPWSQAAKAILEIKGLPYVAAPLEIGGANAEIAAWSGQNGAPIVAWQDEKPINRWFDILLLAERLAPRPALLPAEPRQRALAVGLGTAQALFVGLALSLSSTAFALQVLEERKELTTRHGRLAFSVLLFQDLAAIPRMALGPRFAAVGPTRREWISRPPRSPSSPFSASWWWDGFCSAGSIGWWRPPACARQ